MLKRYRIQLCLSAALIATPAFAQDDLQAQEGDIVVTATRTQSLASKTPIALTAIGSEGLRDAGVSNPTQLADVVPNLSIDRGNGLQITIRGVTSRDGTEKGDPSAAFLLDGIYIARPQAQEVSFYDLERVEVLRGPQGTLFGRNSTAGVVHVISARPVDRFAASADVTYGNFDTVQATAMLNVPVAPGFALRGAVNYDRRDAYITPWANSPWKLDPGKKNLSGRLSALIDFGPDVTLLLRGDYSKIDGRPANTVRLTNFFNRPFTGGTTSPAWKDIGSKAQRTRDYNEGYESFYDNDTWGVMGELTVGLGAVDMTYLGSYREMTRHEQGPQDISPFFPAALRGVFDGHYWQNSQELRFAYNDGGALTAQVGGYYFKEKSGIGAFIINPPPVIFLPKKVEGALRYGFPQDPTISESKGVFGQFTYELVPDLKFTGGVRYSHDLKSRVGQTILEFPAPIGIIPTQQNYARRTFSKVTWRAGLDYDLGNTLLYATVSTGYKAGGFNDGCQSTGPDDTVCMMAAKDLYYEPETITAYEAGFKGRFADGALRLNGSLFHYDYKGMQLSYSAQVCGGPCQVTTNAGASKVDGVELEAVLAPHPAHRFDVSFNYLKARFTDFKPPLKSDSTGKTLVNYAGVPLERSPEFTASAGYTYTQELGGGSRLEFGARVRVSDSYLLADYAEPVVFRNPSYHKTDLTVTYRAPDDRFMVQGFVKNLENVITLQGASAQYSSTAYLADPRTYGVRAGVKF